MAEEYKNYFEPEEYKYIDEEIYTKSHHSNILGRAFHQMRFKTTRELVRKYYIPGQKVIDICCGLCEWNTKNIKVVGLDLNKNTLNLAKKLGRISEIIIQNGLDTNLKKNSFDIIVNTGALEHIKYPSEQLKELKRILKDDGILILGVPYDTFFSLWRPLFWARCFIHGRIKGSKYFLKQGGHINKFSPKSLIGLLRSHDFKIIEIVDDYKLFLTIVAKKVER